METLTTQLSKEQKLEKLNRILEKANNLNSTNCLEPEFLDWKTLVHRTLVKIFGEASIEVKEFKKLTFRAAILELIPYDPKAMLNENQFNNDFSTAKRLIKQLIEDFNSEIEIPLLSENNLPKIEWNGTQKELAELFIELKRKGWVSEIEGNLIQNYFSGAKTIKQILKEGGANYEQVYTKTYKPKFDTIKFKEK